MRSEAPCHASAEALSPCVPPTTVRLAMSAHVGECRVPSPTASIRPCSLHLGGCRGSGGWPRGEEAMRFDDGNTIRLARLACRRRFVVCLVDAERVVQRRDMALSGS